MSKETLRTGKRRRWGVALGLGLLTLSLGAARLDLVPSYGPFDKASYLTPAQLLFIRPGLDLQIVGVTIPEDRRPVVEFTLKDPGGLPLDIDGVFTPGAVSVTFMLARIPQGATQYLSYHERTQTSPITGESAVQADRDRGGTFEEVSQGSYSYRFSTVLPEDYDTGATHTMGAYSRRDLTEFDLDRYVDNALFHFVPAGGEPQPRDVVRTEACNQCHNPLQMHGGQRREVGLCILCHTPQSTDPDTGNTVDLAVMIHKIHRGADLPSVQAGTPYQIIGFRQSVHDYSEVVFPQDVRNCNTCHQSGPDMEGLFAISASPNPIPSCETPGRAKTTIRWNVPPGLRGEIRLNTANGKLLRRVDGSGSVETGNWVRDGIQFLLVDRDSGDVLGRTTAELTVLGCTGNRALDLPPIPGGQHSSAFLTNPSRAVCGSCHDDVDFDQAINHPVAVVSDDVCFACHLPQKRRDFDITIPGAHTVPAKSAQLQGLYIRILDVVDTFPGQNPTVRFEVLNKQGREVNPGNLRSFNLLMAGPTSDYSVLARESARNAVPSAGASYVYTFEAQIPADAEGTFSIGAEASRNVVLDLGNGEMMDFRETAQNPVHYFAVTDAEPEPRRTVVADQYCDRCHGNLSFHGGQRHDPEYCVNCHQPGATDINRRPDEELPEQSISLPFLIHRIHRGHELTRDFTVYGFGNRAHNYNELIFPGDLRDCSRCHVGDSYNVPTGPRLATTAPREFINPMPATTAACVGCHDEAATAAHAATMTAVFGEACAACHGPEATFSVERVHAR